MNQKTIESILNFLTEKPGYKKEGKKRLSYILFKNNIKASIEETEEALRIFNSSSSSKESVKKEVKEDNLEIKSAWQLPNGEWRYSLKPKKEDEMDPEDFWKSFKEEIFELLSDVSPNIFQEKNIDSKQKEKGLFIWTADKHVGLELPKDTLYSDNYDYTTFRNRMFKIISEIKKEYGDKYYDELVISDLGDPLDGYNKQTTRGGHALPQNMNNKEQFLTYIKVHKEFYEELIRLNIAKHFTILNVSNDNHSGDFGYFAFEVLKTYFNIKYPTVTFKIFDKFIDHYVFGNHCFMLSHGKDSEDMKANLPYILNNKTENFINEYIDRKNLHAYYNHFKKGDLHTYGEQTAKRFSYTNVPSIVGSSKWTQHNFGYSQPGCLIEEVDKYKNKTTSKLLLL